MSSPGSGVIKTVAHDKITTTASPIVSTRIITGSVHPPGFHLSRVLISSANLGCKSQRNYESVRGTPSDRVPTSICTSLCSDVCGPVQRGRVRYSLRCFPSTEPNLLGIKIYSTTHEQSSTRQRRRLGCDGL